MSRQSESSSTATRRKTTRRYWRHTDSPRSWWPWGLLPLLGLAVLFLFGALVTAPIIQAEVRTEVADRFDGAGVIATDVTSDGQGVSIRAEALSKDEIYLRALARSTQCDTWAGQLTCPTAVSLKLDEPETTELAPARQEVATAVASVAPREVDDRAQNDVQSCNDGFDEILTDATVRFRTGSATIDTGNEDLLERLAQLAGACPGNLVVEGYTDSRGDADMNQALSLARAAAVRDALARLGVETDRVTAMGFGESNPIADNETADGRAKNRRIAITVNDLN